MTGTELASAAGLSNIAYWKDQLIAAGHTEISSTSRIIYKDSAIDFLKNRQKNPNNTQGDAYKKRQIFNALVQHGWIVEEVYYTVQRTKDFPNKGWYYSIPAGEIRFLGGNYKAIIKNMSYYNSLQTV